jgi:putative oxidoreductase
MRESDEFVRAVTAKQFIVATGLTMAAATVWGFGRRSRARRTCSKAG